MVNIVTYCILEKELNVYKFVFFIKVYERLYIGVRLFKCDYEGCGKVFVIGYGLKFYIRVYIGEKFYKCFEEGCDKGFKISGDF